MPKPNQHANRAPTANTAATARGAQVAPTPPQGQATATAATPAPVQANPAPTPATTQPQPSAMLVAVQAAIAAGPAPGAPGSYTPPVVRTMRAVPGTLNVLKGNLQFKGARAAWYAVLLQHHGQPAQNYLNTCLANPPSLPASKRPEPPSGWLSWFVRNGVCTVVPPASTTPAAPAP